MKKRFITSILLFVCLCSFSIKVMGSDPPVAHYTFSQRASISMTNDFGSSAINATVTGVIDSTTGITGEVDCAYLFNGSSSGLSCGTSNRGITNEVTVSAWIRTTTTITTTQIIVAKYDYNNDRGFALLIASGTVKMDGRDGSGTYRSSGASTTSVNDGNWHHVVGVVNVDTWEIWVDGVLESSFNSGYSATDLTTSLNLTIGYAAINNSWHFPGSIDEVSVYNYALTGNEIDVLSLNDNLVSFYPMGGNAQDRTDLSGPTDDGSVFQATLTTGHNSVSNTAYSFDGTNDRINCGTNNRNITSQITVAAWVRTSLTAYRVIASKYSSVSSTGFLLFASATGRASIDGRDGSGSYRSSGPSSTIIADGNWHHVVGVVNNNTWEIYVDGVLESSTNTGFTSTNLSNPSQLGIGYLTLSGTNYFNGSIDDVRVYNTNLSTTSIQNLAAFNVEALRVGSVDSPFDIENNEAEIYPNPSEGIVEIKQTTEYSKMQLFNSYGILVSEKANSYTLSLEHLPAGMYTLILKDSQGKTLSTHKVIKK